MLCAVRIRTECTNDDDYYYDTQPFWRVCLQIAITMHVPFHYYLIYWNVSADWCFSTYAILVFVDWEFVIVDNETFYSRMPIAYAINVFLRQCILPIEWKKKKRKDERHMSAQRFNTIVRYFSFPVISSFHLEFSVFSAFDCKVNRAENDRMCSMIFNGHMIVLTTGQRNKRATCFHIIGRFDIEIIVSFTSN